MSYHDDLRQFKVDYWKQALTLYAGSVCKAAKHKGVNRTYLCKILKNLDLVGFARPPAPPRKPLTVRSWRVGPRLQGEPKRAPRPKREWGPGAVNAVAPFKKRQARLANAG